MKFVEDTIGYPMAATDPSWNRIFREPPKLACKKMYKRMNHPTPTPKPMPFLSEQQIQDSDVQVHYARERLRALSDMEKATSIVIKRKLSPEYRNKQQVRSHSTL